MAINKEKNLKQVLESSFEKDPLGCENTKQLKIDRDSVPYGENDVMLIKKQMLHHSVNEIFDKLVQNDIFSEKFIDVSHSYSESISNPERIKNTFKYNEGTGGYPPENKRSGEDIYEAEYDKHIARLHGENSYSLSKVKEEYMETDCSNLDVKQVKRHFQSTWPRNHVVSETETITISNDIVTNMEFSDDVINPSNYITISICNKNTGGIFRQKLNNNELMNRSIPSTKEFAYIYKEWISGMKEFYIYIPSTFTFYNDNVDGEDVKNNTTFIRVVINRRHFKINHIYNAEICGQSLPLQIHHDNFPYFNDVILPSLLRTMCVSNETENNTDCIYNDRTNTYTLYFMCYGTDAQSIRLYCD